MNNSENQGNVTETSNSAETQQQVNPQIIIPEPKKQSAVLYNIKQIVLIFIASLATAVALEVFLLPGDTVVGGALGIASILHILLCTSSAQWYFSAGIWVFVINIPIFIYCFATYRRRFAFKTFLYVLFLAVITVVLHSLDVSTAFEKLMYGDGEKDKVIYVILGGALHGVSLPIMLSVNASTGGSDIVGLMMQKRSKQSSSIAMRVVMLTNVAVVFFASVAAYLVKKDISHAVNMFIYSVAAMFVCEIVQEGIFKGFSAALELEITTEKPQEMANALQAGLKHGVTKIKVVGGFSQSEKIMILCVVNKQQLTHARKIINEVDPKAFAYVENVKEVLGKGFANKEIELDEEESASKN